MTEENDAPPNEPAREADRFYGLFLFLLAAASVVAPLFAEATLGWTLFLSGLIGGTWLWIDRTPRGYAAAVTWSLTALLLGLHLTFHLLLGFFPLGLVIGLSFLLMGVAEAVFGMTRYAHSRGARTVLGLAGAASGLFGVMTLILWPEIPVWSGGLTMGLMFAAFGAALEFGAAQTRARLRAG
jgi:uncharacterized membrane protein HdeD (DUF308 family)